MYCYETIFGYVRLIFVKTSLVQLMRAFFTQTQKNPPLLLFMDSCQTFVLNTLFFAVHYGNI